MPGQSGWQYMPKNKQKITLIIIIIIIMVIMQPITGLVITG